MGLPVKGRAAFHAALIGAMAGKMPGHWRSPTRVFAPHMRPSQKKRRLNARRRGEVRGRTYKPRVRRRDRKRWARRAG